MTTRTQVGFSQRIQLAWLERTAELLQAGNTRDQIQAALDEVLKDKLSVGSDARRGNRGKVVTILLKIWVDIPEGIEDLRNDGLEHLKRLPPQEHLPVHWGMTMAVYPFFGMVIETIGRLLRLQGYAAAAQVQRRLSEQLGERETIARAARRIMRCCIDWGVLQETGEKGIYQATHPRPIEDPKLATWLVEAALVASGTRAGTLLAMVQSPALFPFTISGINGYAIESNGRLELFRQGLDEDVVTLRSRAVSR
jgi:hypothetical protein